MHNLNDILHSMDYGPAPEASDYVEDWLAARTNGFELFIGGRWVAPISSTDRLECLNPANGSILSSIAVAGEDDIDAAVSAARKAFGSWAATSGHDRARVLYALARLIQKNSRFIAVLETLDNGKPIRESRDIDVPLAARHFYHHAGWAQILDREFPDQEAIGVIGQIIPWNFPFLMLAWKIAPALAAGNTVVLKPADYTSLTALYFAELAAEAGVPAGVINIVTGAAETGQALVAHPDVNKIAFTGSTEVGREIRRQTAGTAKSLTLELGGKSPFLVFEDADLDSAVEGLVEAIWFNQGEVCCAGSRLLVQESVSERLVAKIKRRLEQFRVGNPLDKSVDMGALVDPAQQRRITDLVAQSVLEGALKWQPEIDLPDQGCFMAPTVLTGVTPANSAMIHEIFGPVLAVTTFRTLDEAVALANNSRYGLAASVWTESAARALDVAGQLKAGVVWVNGANRFDAGCGFGGYRESGFGREGGREGMYAYLKPKRDWLDQFETTTIPEGDGAKPPVIPLIDRTYKHYIGGRQTRPDGGTSLMIYTHDGAFAGRVADGNRKDIREAVEAARKAETWAGESPHLRAQILYYMAENLMVRSEEFARNLARWTGADPAAAEREVSASISRLFSYAAWADKFEGLVHRPPDRALTVALHEPIGIVGVVCPERLPLLAFVSLMAPLMAMGNRSIIVPSPGCPLPALDFVQILETSDVPAGVVNLVTGERDPLAESLADHDGVDGLWYHGATAGAEEVERRSAANLKRIWSNGGRARDWFSPLTGEGPHLLREATQVKNIWLPYGD